MPTIVVVVPEDLLIIVELVSVVVRRRVDISRKLIANPVDLRTVVQRVLSGCEKTPLTFFFDPKGSSSSSSTRPVHIGLQQLLFLVPQGYLQVSELEGVVHRCLHRQSAGCR